jgi:hypothetical protein
MKMILWIDYDLSIPLFKWSLRGGGVIIETTRSFSEREAAIGAAQHFAKRLGITITRIK